MKPSDINHLRRLLAYVECDIGEDPEDHARMVGEAAGKMPPLTEAAMLRLVAHHERIKRVPKYVRAAMKALEKYTRDEGLVVDAKADRTLRIGRH